MIQIDDKINCCGCTACASICVQNAITMKPDGLGFLYPQVDERKCIDCGLCNKVCQFHDDYNRYDNYSEPIVYGCRHRDESELAKSQSGAASFVLVEKFIEEGGVVYGVAFTKGFHVIHKRAVTQDEALAFRGSKYVQSDLRGVFCSIRDDLKSDKNVMFIGTACQVAGLLTFIPSRLKRGLTTIDIVCHATPSPAVWEEYIKYLEQKYNSPIVDANFRNKKFGWRSHVETFKFASGKEIERTTFRFFFFYYNHLSIRKSCSVCHFTNLKRVGDISLADFWGWAEHHQEWNDNKGISLVLVNSDKGRALYESVQERVLSIKSNISECIQPQLVAPVDINPHQEDFIKEFQERGFEYCGKKYGDLSVSFKIKTTLSDFKEKSGLRSLKKKIISLIK